MSDKPLQGKETRITSIEQQKKNRSRFNIYVNDEFAFAVHEDILVKYRLMKDREIDPEEIKEVLLAEEQHRAIQYALRFLSFRPRSTAEVEEYLQKKGFLSPDVESAIAYLLDKNYLDDETYALQWVEERKRLKPRGRYLLRMELMQRGIDDTIAEQAIQGQLSGHEEKEMVIQWIEKKSKGVKYPNLYEMKKKLVPFLQRKGFPLEVIMEGIQAIGDRYME